MSLYYTELPEYTIPYYEPIPRRPRGVFLSTALYAVPLPNMDGLGCAALPENDPWHPPSTYPEDCGKGFVIYVSADTNLRILTTPVRGSGCNSPFGSECAPMYPLVLPLREGRNNVIWCSEDAIFMARPNAMSPWQDLCSSYGNVLLVPPKSQGTIQNYVYTGESYQMVPPHKEHLTQPIVMSRIRCAGPTPPRVSLFVPNGEVPSLKTLALLSAAPTYDTPPIYPGAMATHVIGIIHTMKERAITPPQCICGYDYQPAEEDYTTGALPDGPAPGAAQQ